MSSLGAEPVEDRHRRAFMERLHALRTQLFATVAADARRRVIERRIEILGQLQEEQLLALAMGTVMEVDEG